MSGDKVAVPGVVGLSKAAAVRALQKDGFKAGVQQEYSDRVAEGFVSRQSPHRRHQAARGRARSTSGSARGARRSRSTTSSGWTAGAVDDWLDHERPGGLEEEPASQLGRRGPGVQAGSGGRHGRQARRHRHLLGEQRQAAGDGAGPDEPDAGRRRGEPGGGRVSTWAPSRRPRARRCRPGRSSARTQRRARRSTRGSTVNFVVSTGSPSPSPRRRPSPTSMRSRCRTSTACTPRTAEQELLRGSASPSLPQEAPTPASRRARWSRSSPTPAPCVPEGATTVLLVIAT